MSPDSRGHPVPAASFISQTLCMISEGLLLKEHSDNLALHFQKGTLRFKGRVRRRDSKNEPGLPIKCLSLGCVLTAGNSADSEPGGGSIANHKQKHKRLCCQKLN